MAAGSVATARAGAEVLAAGGNAVDAVLAASIAATVAEQSVSSLGGGGFLMMICKSPQDARAVRRLLEADPPNARARFFDFDISRQGLVVTVC